MQFVSQPSQHQHDLATPQLPVQAGERLGPVLSMSAFASAVSRNHRGGLDDTSRYLAPRGVVDRERHHARVEKIVVATTPATRPRTSS